MRRWTLVAIVLLFLALAGAAVAQLFAGDREVVCPGPGKPLGGPGDVVRCVTPTPSPS